MSNIPTLRFKEFSGEWEEYKLGDISKFRRGSFPQPYGLPEWYDDENGMPFVQVFDVDSNMKLKPETKNKISALAQPSSVFVEKGNIVLTIQGSIGRIALTQYDAFVDRTLLIFTDYIIPINKEFFMYLVFLLFEIEKRNAPGGTIKTITKEALSDFNLSLPNIEEQQKIASFLSAVDTKIDQLTRKKELLEQYKKGVMQKVFSQELRFKADDGSEFPEWEEKKLEDFLTLALREIPTPKENYLSLGVRSHGKGTFQKPDADPDKISMDKLYKVKENDLIVSITFAWEGAIAIVKKEDEGGLVSHRFPTYVFNTAVATHEYFKYVITQKNFRLMLDLISPGGAGRNRVMSKKDFIKLSWLMPSLAEQTKIANFLTAIDTKIDFVAEQLDEAKNFKKGLLQQMFV